jgi:hypothetical protein
MGGGTSCSHNSSAFEAHISREIAEITGISEKFLTREVPLDDACIAKKMSWAARRSTTRSEDQAYSLLGIFNVNMPLLYGEGGQKAFRRLQLEIIQRSTDQSIFAWKPYALERHLASSMLASAPKDFKDSGNIVLCKGDDRPYAITNKGLEMRVPLLELDVKEASTHRSVVYVLRLACKRPGRSRCPVLLEKDGESRYCRIPYPSNHRDSLSDVQKTLKEERLIYIKADSSEYRLNAEYRPRGLDEETEADDDPVAFDYQFFDSDRD